MMRLGRLENYRVATAGGLGREDLRAFPFPVALLAFARARLCSWLARKARAWVPAE
jgi:hypothetical protein